MAERFPYRGYDILPSRQWSNWCVPFVSRSRLDILRPRLQDAINEAKMAIDRALEDLPAKVA